MTLTYVDPPGCPKLKAGARVKVCDRTGAVVGEAVVKRSGRSAMTMEDGRKFRNGTGWYAGGTSDFPFPFIRMFTLAENQKAKKS